MKLYEYQGAELFKQYKIPVAPYFVISSLSDLKNKKTKKNLIVKAQVLIGKRGKHGGVVSATPETLYSVCQDMFRKKIRDLSVKKILIAEKEPVQEEWYLVITINRFLKQYTLLFSTSGGIDIEELAQTQPKKIMYHSFSVFHEKEITRFLQKIKIQNLKKEKNKDALQNQLRLIIKKLFLLMQEKDATLVEINPILVTPQNKLIAADSKIIIDDNALYRQKFSQEEDEKTVLEKKAAQQGLAYVELDGNIGVIGNGAGMVMATLDVLSFLGGKPGSFLDIGGGTGQDIMEKALSLTLKKKLHGLFINIFAGITHCDEIAKGLAHYKQKYNIKLPIVVRMIGMYEKEGKTILEKQGIHAMNSMEEAARKIVKMVNT